MKYSLILTLVLILNRCYSQSESVVAYYLKEKDFNHILLLGCNVGYSYSGPHLFTDEVFTYEVEGDKIIRNFDPEYSLRKRVDTLMITNRSLIDINGLSYKKTTVKKRDELIEKYIQPSTDSGFFKIFLEKLRLCKEDG
ncbi:hypothetical protein [Lunatimonas salinarum]|uniref:hypothetical protein n=1 Tax=Lunatimonas salinarum TaxID=1774590 RepID=UPI001ADFB43C|nr:hypothetical protein [Lunatimonas salinarum]